MQGASTDKIIDIVKKCPTDALIYTYNDGRPSPKAPQKENTEFVAENRTSDKSVKIDVIKGGPLLVKGEVIIKGPDGEEIKKPKVAYFCRCGNSSRMPFCDGTHRKIGFDK